MRSLIPFLCATLVVALPYDIVRRADTELYSSNTTISGTNSTATSTTTGTPGDITTTTTASIPSGTTASTSTSPTATASDYSLPGLLLFDGQPVSIESTPICDATEDDVMQCAINRRKLLQNPSDVTRALTHTIQNDDSVYLKATYNSTVESCEITDPYIVDQEPLWVCNINSCSKSIALQTSQTDTTRYGYKITTNVKAQTGVKDVWSTEITFGVEQSTDWTNTQTTTKTVTDTWQMSNGQICAPTSIQMSVKCKSKVDIEAFTAYNADGSVNHLWADLPNNICTAIKSKSDVYSVGTLFYLSGSYLSDSQLDEVWAICQGNTDPSGAISTDLGNGATTGESWSVQGCMRS